MKNPDFSDWSSQIETLQIKISDLNDALDQVSADIDFKMNQVSTIERELESTYGLLEEENKKVKNWTDYSYIYQACSYHCQCKCVCPLY